jgi:hypothetical protein
VAVAALAWVLVALVPIVPVVRIGSAYFYAFAVTGAALGLAAAASAWPRGGIMAAVLALGLLSHHARGADAFAENPGAWAPVSHVNRRYIERAGEVSGRLLETFVRTASPVQPGTLFLVGGVPPFAGFLAGDGAVLRHAFGDTSLKAVFVSQFHRRLVGRGPVRSFSWLGDRYLELPREDLFFTVGASLTEFGASQGARDAFELSLEREPAMRTFAHEYLGYVLWAAGDTAGAREAMAAAGRGTAGLVASGRIEGARAALARGDTTTAIDAALAASHEAPFDPAPHALLAEVTLVRPQLIDFTIFQGYAWIAIAPRDPAAWRLWAHGLAARGRAIQARAAVARFRALAPGAGRADAQMNALEARLARPGPPS